MARTIAFFSILSMSSAGCSLRILGVDKASLTSDANSSSGINAFSVLGASGGSDASADAYLTDGTTVTAEWVDTTGEDSYEVKILDSSGGTTLCGPATVAADTIRYTFSSCALSHALTYRIQVTAKNSTTGAAQSAQATFQVGPFLSVGDLTVNEWGIASIPVSLSYASASPVSVQYVTTDSTALSGSDYIHAPLTTLTIPAGQTSAMISIPLLTDRAVESSEDFRIELSSPSGAGLLSSSARVTLEDDDLSPASGFTQVSAGGLQTCALTSAGAVQCWGSNGFGEVGDNSTTQRDLPTEVQGLSSGITQVSAGGSHSCALTSAGGVKCWGRGTWGRLGDGTTIQKNVPTDVSGLSSGITQIVTGDAHTCALTSAGAVKCWGHNANGKLGDNTNTNRSVPTDVFGPLTGITQISAGNYHTCALTSLGGVKCWGQNGDGQLGDNSALERRVPTDVFGPLSGVTQISTGGFHTCALTSAGGVKCWGINQYGSLGDNTTSTRYVPTDVFGLSSGVVQVAAGGEHTCALTSAGGVKCWGYNDVGQVGDNSPTNRLVPTDVPGLSTGVIQIAAGQYHTCALISSGALKCWGYNIYGQLGDHGPSSRSAPIDTFGLSSSISQVAAAMGGHFTCALNTSGAIKCWGTNLYGQLGDNSTTSRFLPVDVPGLSSGMTQVAAGGVHSCALTSAGAVKCWGYNFYGQVGDNTSMDRVIPSDVTGLSSGMTQIATGGSHTCGLSSSGGVKCWGYNGSGQLGDNSTVNKQVPTDVFGLSSGVIQITTGNLHTCALTSSGGVKCWGNGAAGQLGDNSSVNKQVPTDVVGLSSGVIQVAAGNSHTCALTSAGAVKCWGMNTSGQLGDNTSTSKQIPTDVLGLSSGVIQIGMAGFHTCALTSSGAVKCWGTNSSGQLGDRSLIQRTIPVDVSGLSSGVVQVTGGGSHTCALTSSGALKCWGSNFYGQIGESYTNLIP